MKFIVNRWSKNWAGMLRDFLSSLGLFWLVLELINFYFPTYANFLSGQSIFIAIIAISFLYAGIRNYPRSSFVKKIRSKDVHIELRIGDAFKNDGALVIPINNQFDLTLGGNVKKAKSLQGQLIENFYDSKEEHLLADISNKIDLSRSPFSSGVTVEVEQKKKKFYLLVNSKKGENNRVSSDIDDFMLALNGLWDYLANESGKDDAVTIPLLNTQHGRDSNLNRETVVKQTIETFIDATIRKIVCDKLIISICPADLKKGDINFEGLVDYLNFQCENYKDIRFVSKPSGKEISPSEIESIES